MHFAPQQQVLGFLAGIERREIELLQAYTPVLAQLLLTIEVGIRGRQFECLAEVRLVGLIFAFQAEHRGRGHGGFPPVGRRGRGERKQECQRQQGGKAKSAAHGAVPGQVF